MLTPPLNKTNETDHILSCFPVEKQFGVFIVDFEHISNLVLVFLLLTLNM